MDKSLDPSTPSLAHARLADQWKMIRAILAGAESVRAGGTTYLPKNPAESDDEYDRRKASAPWRPEFEDIVRGISAKPFAKETVLAGKPSDQMKAIAEDIDGRGNNLHVFAKDMFESGVSLGAHGILIDFPTMAPDATLKQEQDANARPYWVSVDADEILSLRTERVGAREVVTHLRLKEVATVVNGFEEITVNRVRLIEPKYWEIWEEKTTATGAKEWASIGSGVLTLDEVPFVFYATAERCGPQEVRPPLLSIANLQIELYHQGSAEEQAYTMAAAPLLSANGMGAPAEGSVEVGPGRVLYAPGGEGYSSSWSYVQCDPENLRAISERRIQTAEEMRRLGLQPIVAKTGNVTATASGIEAAKGHSAVQTWANGLKDALEQAFMFTAKWLKTNEQVEVNVNADFAVGMYGEAEIAELRAARLAGDLSQLTYWDELLRRGVLGPQFDAGVEAGRIETEGQALGMIEDEDEPDDTVPGGAA